MNAAEASLAHQRVRSDETAARHARLRAEYESLAEAGEDGTLGKVVAELESRLEEARQRLLERQREIAELRRAEAAEAGVLHKRRERLEAMSGRLASLDALQQAALARQSGEAAEWLEAHGLNASPRLAQIIDVAPEWAYAVECVLGSRLEAVRVDDTGRYAPALGALDRATVSLVADPRSAGPAPPGDELGGEVRAGRELAAPWLAGVGTARTAADALERRAALAPHQSLITTDGTWVGPNWIRVFRRRDDEAGLLAREREIASLRESLAAAESETGEGQAALARIRVDLAAAEGDRELLEAAWTDANERYARLRSEHAVQAAEAQARLRRREELGREIEEIGETLAGLVAVVEEGDRAVLAVREAGRRIACEGEEIDGRAEKYEAEVSAGRKSAEKARQAVHEAALALESTTVQVAALDEAPSSIEGSDGGAAGGHGGVASPSCRDRGTHRRCREETSRALGEPP